MFTSFVPIEAGGVISSISPLGDAADLMHHLERAFSAMVHAKFRCS